MTDGIGFFFNNYMDSEKLIQSPFRNVKKFVI